MNLLLIPYKLFESIKEDTGRTVQDFIESLRETNCLTNILGYKKRVEYGFLINIKKEKFAFGTRSSNTIIKDFILTNFYEITRTPYTKYKYNEKSFSINRIIKKSKK